MNYLYKTNNEYISLKFSVLITVFSVEAIYLLA